MGDSKKPISVPEEVDGVFLDMETQAERQAPGVLDVLKVYGGYEDALRQAESYLSGLNPSPRASSSNNTQ